MILRSAVAVYADASNRFQRGFLVEILTTPGEAARQLPTMTSGRPLPFKGLHQILQRYLRKRLVNAGQTRLLAT